MIATNWTKKTRQATRRRIMAIEPLAKRELFAADLAVLPASAATGGDQAAAAAEFHRFDLNRDGVVDQQDAKVIGDMLTEQQASGIVIENASMHRFDVSEDWLISPKDMLLIINHIQAQNQNTTPQDTSNVTPEENKLQSDEPEATINPETTAGPTSNQSQNSSSQDTSTTPTVAESASAAMSGDKDEPEPSLDPDAVDQAFALFASVNL